MVAAPSGRTYACPMMQLAPPSPISRTCPEREIYNALLALDGKDILELGCGRAEITRAIASEGTDRRITALEVDEIQHRNHLAIDDLPNVRFVLAGAEAIPAPDAAFDVVFMFKSLHHVPIGLMDKALAEVRRVLRPGGLAYISEPVFAGEFNEILRLFHDEEQVRRAAFEAITRAVDTGVLGLAQEIFFHSPMHFDDFADFEAKILRVTHTDHQLSAELYDEVRRKFEDHLGPHGADFLMPIRVDLLHRAD